MAYKIEYVNTYTGRALELNALDATSGITVSYLGDIGFGLAPMHHITARGPMQDGDTYVDMRFDPRVIQLPLLIQPGVAVGQTRMQRLYYARQVLASIFNPIHESYIRFLPDWDTDPTNARYLKGRVVGGLDFTVDPQMPYDFRTVVQYRAANPIWYNDDASVMTTISNAQFGSFVPVTNAGNYKSAVIFFVTGPVTNFRIASAQGAYVLFIQVNGTIPAGDMWSFDLQPGIMSVQDSAGNNKISTISLDSNFGTFAIPPGSSSLRCTGTGTTAATSVDMYWTPAYSGV